MAQTYSWPDVLTALVQGKDMDEQSASWAMIDILSGNVPPSVMAAFMVSLRAKGETVDEVSGLAKGMLAKALPIDLPSEAVDIVGSGGDRANTVNISTMAAVVAAAAGAKVVKHGNRSASSKCGAADCLEELGVNLHVPPANQARVLDECNLVFLFAPMYHGSLKYSAPVRRELGILTTFNFLGPMSNPARPKGHAIGIANLKLAEICAGVLMRRGGRGMVFHGDDGLDELTTTTKSDVWLFNDGKIIKTEIDPAQLGIAPAAPQDLEGGLPPHNAQVLRDLLAGKKDAVRDIVLLNAAAALLGFDGPDLAAPLHDQMAARLARASEAIDSGDAEQLFNRWVRLTQELA